MQNPYQQPYNPYNLPKQPIPSGKGSKKRKIITGAAIGTAITAVIVPIVVALINAHVLFPPPVMPTPVPPTSSPNTPQPTFPSLASFYKGTMNRVTDGMVFQFNLQQVSENSQNGKFTASSMMGGCPANAVGQVNPDNTISFEIQENTNCGLLIGVYSGNIKTDGSMGGQWFVPNTQPQIGGSWSATP